MIPALNERSERRLARHLVPAVTAVTAEWLSDQPMTLLDGDEAARLGISVAPGTEATVVVTDPDRPVGHCTLGGGGQDALLFVDNRGGPLQAAVRVLGDGAALVFSASGETGTRLPTVLLRSHGQLLFWGRGATAVGLSVELEGEGEALAVGDDALVADEVWVRNHDMHALHDLASGRCISRLPVSTVLERHVWLGQGALLLSCTRVGAGTVVGARSLVKNELPGCVAAAGVPARVLREGVSWGRSSAGMSAEERLGLGLPELAHA